MEERPKGDVRGEEGPTGTNSSKSRPKFDGDVIISLRKGEGSQLLTSRMAVFCKMDDGDFRQIGLLQHFKLEADLSDLIVSVTAKFIKELPDMSDQLKSSLEEGKKLLTKSGVSIDLCTCEVTNGSFGLDPNCPVHLIKGGQEEQ